jgi:hypothetical protein
MRAVRRKPLERTGRRADSSSIDTPDASQEPTMKNLTNHLTRITMIAAMAAAGFSVQTAHAAQQKAVRVVQLQPVVVTAKRLCVVQLPTVVIVAKRLAPAPTVVAQRSLRNPPV